MTADQVKSFVDGCKSPFFSLNMLRITQQLKQIIPHTNYTPTPFDRESSNRSHRKPLRSGRDDSYDS